MLLKPIIIQVRYLTLVILMVLSVDKVNNKQELQNFAALVLSLKDIYNMQKVPSYL